MSELTEVPAFRGEEEEAQWWFEHRDEHDARLLEAVESGTSRRITDVLLDYGLKLEGVKEVAIPVGEADLDAARHQAAGFGMEFHQYMGKLLHEALMKSDAA